MKKERTEKSTEPLLDIKELAEEMNLTVSFLTKAYREYGLPYFQLGSLIRFRISKVEAWLRAHERSA